MGVTNMDKCLQSAHNIPISCELCLQASNNPEAHSYAAVMVITELDDEGSISLDRTSLLRA